MKAVERREGKKDWVVEGGKTSGDTKYGIYFADIF